MYVEFSMPMIIEQNVDVWDNTVESRSNLICTRQVYRRHNVCDTKWTTMIRRRGHDVSVLGFDIIQQGFNVLRSLRIQSSQMAHSSGVVLNLR